MEICRNFLGVSFKSIKIAQICTVHIINNKYDRRTDLVIGKLHFKKTKEQIEVTWGYYIWYNKWLLNTTYISYLRSYAKESFADEFLMSPDVCPLVGNWYAGLLVCWLVRPSSVGRSIRESNKMLRQKAILLIHL